MALSGQADLGEAAQVSVWQDFCSEREFSRMLMSEFHRRLEIYHRLTVRLPPRKGVARHITLFRPAGDPPFTERDKVLLSVLRPHLASIRDRFKLRHEDRVSLTPRQVDLGRHLALGKTNRKLANDLGLAEGTVRKHPEKLYRRLGVNSRIEALARVAKVAPSQGRGRSAGTKGPHSDREDAVVFAITEVYQSPAGWQDHVRRSTEEWEDYPAFEAFVDMFEGWAVVGDVQHSLW